MVRQFIDPATSEEESDTAIEKILYNPIIEDINGGAVKFEEEMEKASTIDENQVVIEDRIRNSHIKANTKQKRIEMLRQRNYRKKIEKNRSSALKVKKNFLDFSLFF